MVDPPSDEFYELEASYAGSFTRPGVSEAALVFQGCESHAENWGGTLLVERQGSGWAPKSYRSGFHPAECQTFRVEDGRDRLLCRWGTGHQGVNFELLDVYDFLPDDPARPDAGWTSLLACEDNSVSGCFDARNEPLRASRIDAYRLETAKPLRLLVDVRVAELRPTAAFHARCEEMAKATDQGPELRDLLRFERKRLVFTWDGNAFVPDTPTRTFIKARHLSVRDSEQ